MNLLYVLIGIAIAVVVIDRLDYMREQKESNKEVYRNDERIRLTKTPEEYYRGKS
ncbi:hypothetical protein [Gracilimonas sediminicola]|uniref:Uncharacterized protein n=1 Tax=Gracilimonas sediminicola TaxID=2952158 RepID=A0A9X2L0Q1_9BACT|nr:hypothetical protein [Gracilimonas sediminicola]MCP9290032.1 hypothetical protein [Gracilimonas sediminicola]